ncbi:unnamed protein product [Phytophthora fragariaefolia]|uniref:Unnamed protein product n=1 Tax=Phytophthora fragariaefolia TaxID=1490495 RepID=A0A9W6XBU9_9STRA|nr:unnamed protein product [Phytophthora fragariaefolia]
MVQATRSPAQRYDTQLLVQWKGLEDVEDSYEPLSSLAHDVPALVNQYVASADQELNAHWQQAATTGEQQRTAPMTVTETVRPQATMRRRSRRRRPSKRTSNPYQAPNISHPVVAVHQTARMETGPADQPQDTHTPRRLQEVQAEEQSVGYQTRSGTAGVDRKVPTISKK